MVELPLYPMFRRFCVVASLLFSVIPFPALAIVETPHEQVDESLRRLETDVDRPALRIVRKRAVGERVRRAQMRSKKSQYMGGRKERIGELQFHRSERRQQRLSEDE